MVGCGMFYLLFFFCNDTATTEIYTYCHTLSLHDALPIYPVPVLGGDGGGWAVGPPPPRREHRLREDGARRLSRGRTRSEEHTSELQSLMRISYAVFCLTKKILINNE